MYPQREREKEREGAAGKLLGQGSGGVSDPASPPRPVFYIFDFPYQNRIFFVFSYLSRIERQSTILLPFRVIVKASESDLRLLGFG